MNSWRQGLTPSAALDCLMVTATGPKWCEGYVYDVNENTVRIVTSTLTAWMEREELWLQNDNPRIQPPGSRTGTSIQQNQVVESANGQINDAVKSALVSWRKMLRPNAKVDCLIVGKWCSAFVYETKPDKVRIATSSWNAYWEKSPLWINHDDSRVQPPGWKTSKTNENGKESLKNVNGELKNETSIENEMGALKRKIDYQFAQAKSFCSSERDQRQILNDKVIELEVALVSVKRTLISQDSKIETACHTAAEKSERIESKCNTKQTKIQMMMALQQEEIQELKADHERMKRKLSQFLQQRCDSVSASPSPKPRRSNRIKRRRDKQVDDLEIDEPRSKKRRVGKEVDDYEAPLKELHEFESECDEVVG